MSMSRKTNNLTLVVLGFYLFYALLPLLYSTSMNAGGCPGSAYSGLHASEQAVLDQELQLVPAHESTADPSGSAAQILLKKKRAIAPSSKEMAVKLFSLFAAFAHVDPTVKASFISVPAAHPAVTCPNGFQRYHSGASPPVA